MKDIEVCLLSRPAVRLHKKQLYIYTGGAEGEQQVPGWCLSAA